MKKPIFLNLKNSIIAISLAGLSISTSVQAHYQTDEIFPYYFFFYDLDYAPRHHLYNRGHLIKKHHHKHHHKHPKRSHSHDHYSRHKSRIKKQHGRDHRDHDRKRQHRKYDDE